MKEKIIGRLEMRVIQTKRRGGDLVEEAVAKKAKLDGRPLTQAFANELVSSYGAKEDLFEGLELAMDSAPRLGLLEALKKATANSNNIRDVEDLLSFLQNSSKISVTEFVGMVQNVYACKCMSRVAKDRVWIELLRHLHRHELKNVADFTEVLKVAHVCFDGALYSHFCRLSARGQDRKIWCQRNKDIAAYTLDHADLNVVLGSLSDLPAVAESISRQCARQQGLGQYDDGASGHGKGEGVQCF